jgi:hypothetical protein
MEQVIDGFKNICLKQNNYELELSELIYNIENLSTHDPDFEWKRLTDNYSKLKTLSNLVNDECHFFDKPLLLFMKKMDFINEYYLKNIDFDNIHELNEYNYCDMESVYDTIKLIKSGLLQSIEDTNPYNKLKFVVYTYEMIINTLKLLSGLDYTFIQDIEIEREFGSKRQRTK